MTPSLSFIIELARSAGEILRQRFGKPQQVDYKGLTDLVTEADHRSEQFIIQQIRDNFPNHAIVGEESGVHSGSENDQWYVDPLDGTINYAHGVPLFCVSIGYARNGQLQAGVIYDPIQNECFSAERGKGAWLNGKPIQVSQASELIKSLLVTGFPYDIRTTSDTNLEHFSYFTLHSQSVRRLGSAALDMAYVAAGRLDAYWQLSIKPWDIAAGVLLVQEANGKVTNLQGGPDFFKPPYALIAAAPGIYEQVLAGINRDETRSSI